MKISTGLNKLSENEVAILESATDVPILNSVRKYRNQDADVVLSRSE